MNWTIVHRNLTQASKHINLNIRFSSCPTHPLLSCNLIMLTTGTGCKHKMTLARAMPMLVGGLDNKPILDHLLSKDVISWENYNTIHQKLNPHEQSRSLISLLSRKSTHAFDVFSLFLERNHSNQDLHATLMGIYGRATKGKSVTANITATP